MTNRRTVVNRTVRLLLKCSRLRCSLFSLVAGMAFGQERFGELNGVAMIATGAVLGQRRRLDDGVTQRSARTRRQRRRKAHM